MWPISEKGGLPFELAGLVALNRVVDISSRISNLDGLSGNVSAHGDAVEGIRNSWSRSGENKVLSKAVVLNIVGLILSLLGTMFLVT